MARGGRLKRAWAQLPKDRWLAERELDGLLLELTNSYPGDLAYAGALRGTLVNARTLEMRQVEGSPEHEYRRGEWTDWSDHGPGSAGYNAELQRLHREQEQLLREQDERAAQALLDGPWGQQQRVLIDLVNRAVDERIRALLASDEDAVTRMRDWLNGGNGRNTTGNAGNGRPEGDEGR